MTPKKLSAARIAEYQELAKDHDGIFGYGCIEEWLEHHAALEAENAALREELRVAKQELAAMPSIIEDRNARLDENIELKKAANDFLEAPEEIREMLLAAIKHRETQAFKDLCERMRIERFLE